LGRVERYEFPPSVNEEKIILDRVERYEYPPPVNEEKISLDRVERYEFSPSVNEEKISLDRVERYDYKIIVKFRINNDFDTLIHQLVCWLAQKAINFCDFL
jgi:hypothetical protein